MALSQADYYRDAVLMAANERCLTAQDVIIADSIAHDAAAFNAAIWAAYRLREVIKR